jgi:hypothetical protein
MRYRNLLRKAISEQCFILTSPYSMNFSLAG